MGSSPVNSLSALVRTSTVRASHLPSSRWKSLPPKSKRVPIPGMAATSPASSTSPAEEPSGALARSQAARRRRVLDATLRLAGEGGLDAVQMRDVAAAAGVALGTVYRYFSSKERLLLEAMA